MSRRVNLPAADDLFRPTEPQHDETAPVRRERRVRAVPTALSEEPDDDTRRRPSGRVRHDEKITIYVTADELVDLEHARLELRRSHRISSDRGRIVREAIAIVLADLNLNGEDSVLVDRLRSR